MLKMMYVNNLFVLVYVWSISANKWGNTREPGSSLDMRNCSPSKRIISHNWKNWVSYIRLTTQIFTEQKQVIKEEVLSDCKNREVIIMLIKEYYRNKYSTLET